MLARHRRASEFCCDFAIRSASRAAIPTSIRVNLSRLPRLAVGRAVDSLRVSVLQARRGGPPWWVLLAVDFASGLVSAKSQRPKASFSFCL